MYGKFTIVEKFPVSAEKRPRRIVSPVSAKQARLHFAERQRQCALANPRWSERSEWNLGHESQRIIAHRRCRLTSTRERNIVADGTHLRSSLSFSAIAPRLLRYVGIRRGRISDALLYKLLSSV